MPAVTVANYTTLPRIPRPSHDSRERPLLGIADAPSGLEGEGFPVKRAFAPIRLEYLDPFIMMDQMGAVEYAVGEAKGTPWHPHRGFETVTYLIDGTFRHQDSHGGGGIIGDGDTQWMTAGAGVLHIETPIDEIVQKGGLVHGFQLWVNLPSKLKWAEPRYQDIGGQHLTLLSSEDGGALVRVIAGSIAGHGGPGVTHTPINLIHATISPGSRLTLPWPEEYNALAYVLGGNATLGDERTPIQAGQAAVFGAGQHLTVTADEVMHDAAKDLEILLLGGQPIREQVAWGGPFVMNTEDEVRQAFADYRAGKMGAALAPKAG